MEDQQITPPLEERVRNLLGEEPTPPLISLLEETDPHLLANVFYHFNLPEQQALLGIMPMASAAVVLSELNEHTQVLLFEQIPPERVAAYVNEMEPDDAADLYAQLNPHKARRVMDLLQPAQRERLVELLRHDPDTAGGIMDPDVVQVRSDQTVATAINDVKRYVEEVELDDFFSIFVVDASRRLAGVVPTWKMLLAEEGQIVADIMIPDPISVEAHLDQEEVTRIVRDHDLVTMPVVDGQRRLIGRITVDDVMDVVQEEHAEDLGHLAGAVGEYVREPSLAHTLRIRMPWLLLAFFGQLVAALIMRMREDYLVLIPQLAFFIPMIMAMGGNTGIQSSTLVIRGLATGEIGLGHFWRRLVREMAVAFMVGVLFALLLTGGGVLITGNPWLGVVTGLALLSSILIASTIGIIIPMVLKRLNQDPALATGPFLTTMNDILGILVYLMVARALLF